jgi:glutathione S-transferase
MTTTLYVGEYNYSSWSLRPWLVMKWSRIAFDEQFISLDQPGYGESGVAAIAAVSPSRKVPVLHADSLIVWDSLAIAEWAAEHTRAEPLWPLAADARAEARAVTAEMHSGFSALRRDLPMNIRRRCAAQLWSQETRLDLERVKTLWETYRKRFQSQGSYLFGARSVADAFFTPVATRLRTYSVTLSPIAQAYCDTLLTDPAFLEWEQKALAQWRAPFSRAAIDSLYLGADLAQSE